MVALTPLKGGEELKRFNMKVGFGIGLLKHNDIILAILTGENSKIVLSRAKKLNVKEVHVNVKDKLKKVSDIAFNYNVWLDVNVAYIGDDLSDIDVIKKAALSFAPADAVEEVACMLYCQAWLRYPGFSRAQGVEVKGR